MVMKSAEPLLGSGSGTLVAPKCAAPLNPLLGSAIEVHDKERALPVDLAQIAPLTIEKNGVKTPANGLHVPLLGTAPRFLSVSTSPPKLRHRSPVAGGRALTLTPSGEPAVPS